MSNKKIEKTIEKERSTGQKVARRFGISLIVIAAFWGVFAAPLVAFTVGYMEVVVGYLILGLFFFLISLPLLYIGHERKEKAITAITDEHEEVREERRKDKQAMAQSKRPKRSDYPDDESYEEAIMKYLQDTDQVSRPRLEPSTREELSENRMPPPSLPQQQPLPQPLSTEPQLVPGEQALWRRDLTKGIFRKQIIETQMITNQAIRINQQALDLSVVDDIQVTNKHSRSEGSYTSYGKYGVRMGQGRSRSRQYGDLVFFSRGQIVFTVQQVEDPHGLVRLIKAAMKRQP
jgi:hypothetical protein